MVPPPSDAPIVVSDPQALSVVPPEAPSTDTSQAQTQPVSQPEPHTVQEQSIVAAPIYQDIQGVYQHAYAIQPPVQPFYGQPHPQFLAHGIPPQNGPPMAPMPPPPYYHLVPPGQLPPAMFPAHINHPQSMQPAVMYPSGAIPGPLGHVISQSGAFVGYYSALPTYLPMLGGPMPAQGSYPMYAPPGQMVVGPSTRSHSGVLTGPGRRGGGSYHHGKTRSKGSISYRSTRNQPILGPTGSITGAPGTTTMGSTHDKSVTLEQRSSFVLGPPRKPRQNGYALWIGNLPIKSELMEVVEHVCNHTLGLESLFLISKSNCAFANFKDEESWKAARANIHNSEIREYKLVARHRRIAPDMPTGLATTTSLDVIETQPMATSSQAVAPSTGALAQSDDLTFGVLESRRVFKDRFFVLKSLTVDDLELSVKSGVWATQSHNEQALNDAFKHAENVYLLFSANKSGEYFGYARMMSPLNDDPAAAIEFAPLSTQAIESGVPWAVPEPARGNIPAGRIVNDTLRGTIFWEVEREDDDQEQENEPEEPAAEVEAPTSSALPTAPSAEESKTLGKPFKLQWISTDKVAFHCSKSITNEWNSNREVKIARDGTEIEPRAGAQLISLFRKDPIPGGGVAKEEAFRTGRRVMEGGEGRAAVVSSQVAEREEELAGRR